MNPNAIKILLVEDSENDYIIVRDALRDTLGTFSPDDDRFDLLWAETYEAGLTALHTMAPDVILLDYFLDVGTGLEWLGEARQFDAFTPVVMMTGQGDHDIDLQAMQAGVADYIVKDQLSGTLLERTIRYAIERERAARALRESENRYRSLFDTNPQPCFVYDCVSLAFLAVNRAAIEHYGYSRDEFLSMTLFDIRRLEDRPHLIEHLQRRSDLEPNQVISQHQCKDGSLIQVELSSNALPYDGRGARLVVVNDVTERQAATAAREAAAEALRESEERLHLVTRATNDAIWDWNLETGQVWRNHSFKILFGFGVQPENPASEAWQKRLHPDDAARVTNGIRHIIESGRQSWSDEYRLRRTDGTYSTVLDRGFVLRDEVGKPLRMIGSALDISARKEAEATLAQSENRFRSLISATAAIVWNTAQLGDFDAPQPNWGDFTGQSWADLRGRNWLEAVHPDDRAATLEAFQTALETRQFCQLEHRLKRADGQWSDMLVRAVPILELDGTVREWVGAHTDITQRKQAEAALRRGEERYRSLVRASSQIVWTASADGTQMDSPDWMEFTGQSEAQTQNLGWLDALHPDDRAPIALLWQGVTSSHAVYETEYRLQHHDGTYRVMATRAVPILGSDGNIREWVGMTSDISERKQAEDERDRFFTVSLDLLCIADSNGYFQRLNPAFETTLGYSMEELMARPCLDFVHPDDVEMTMAELSLRQSGISEAHVVNRYVHRDGSVRWLSWTAAWRNGLCYATARDITDLKLAEAELRNSFSLVQATLEATADAILVVDSDGRVSDFNRKFIEMWGIESDAVEDVLELEDALQNENEDLMLRCARQRLIEPSSLLSVVEEEASRSGQISDWLRFKDGRTIARFSQPQSLNGEELGRVWSFRDITHRLEATALQERLTAQLQAQRQRLDDILANVPGIVWEYFFSEFPIDSPLGSSLNPNLTAAFQKLQREGTAHSASAPSRNYASSYAQELLGYELADWLKNPRLWDEVVFEDDRPAISARLLDMLENKPIEPLQLRLVRRDGQVLWAEARYDAIRDEANQIIGVRGVAMDISARVQADEEQSRLAVLLENTTDYVSWATNSGEVRYINPAGRRIIGIGPDEDISGRGIWEMHPNWANEIIHQGIPVAQCEGVWSGNTALLSRDGREIPVSQVVMANRDESGQVMFLATICRDVSAQRRVEAELQSANNSLELRVAERTAALERANVELSGAKEEAERANGAKSEFLSRMSHELRTPLNAILGFGQLLEMHELDEKDLECVEQILKAGKHLLGLINEVLDIARIEAGRLSLILEPLCIDQLLQESLDLVRTLAAKRSISLQNEMSGVGEIGGEIGGEIENGFRVMADRQRLHQVMLNLLSNAIKYNVDGGGVTVSGRIVKARTLETRAFESDDASETRFRIEVRDSGPGLSPEQQELIFVPFERLGMERSKVEGTGIGLALCRHLIHAMNGAIGCVSEIGEGSTFWIELPCAPPEAAVLPASNFADPLQFETLPFNQLPFLHAAAGVMSGNSPPAPAPAGAVSRLESAEESAAETAADENGEAIEDDLPPEMRALIDAIPASTVLYIEDNVANLRFIENLFIDVPQIQLLTATRGDIGLERARVHRPDLIILDVHLPGIWGGEVMSQLQKSPETRDIPVVVLSADSTPAQIETLMNAGARQYITKPIGVEALLEMVGRFLRMKEG